MPRKKNIPKVCNKFLGEVQDISHFIIDMKGLMLTKKQETWIYEYAIIRLYADFENFILELLVSLINKDTNILIQKTGFKFPLHLNVDVCQYLLIKDGYFNFNGRSDLIREIKKYIPDDFPPYDDFVKIFKSDRYKRDLEIFFAARNLAAHHSKKSLKSFREAVGSDRFKQVGVWLKSKEGNTSRFDKLCNTLTSIANDVKNWYSSNFS